MKGGYCGFVGFALGLQYVLVGSSRAMELLRGEGRYLPRQGASGREDGNSRRRIEQSQLDVIKCYGSRYRDDMTTSRVEGRLGIGDFDAWVRLGLIKRKRR